MEATQDSHRCKLLHPLSYHCFAIDDFDTAKEDIEAVCHKGGVNID